jgi:hypothetical protein
MHDCSVKHHFPRAIVPIFRPEDLWIKTGVTTVFGKKYSKNTVILWSYEPFILA